MLQAIKQFSSFYGACRFNTLLETQINIPHSEAQMDPPALPLPPPKFLNPCVTAKYKYIVWSENPQ